MECIIHQPVSFYPAQAGEIFRDNLQSKMTAARLGTFMPGMQSRLILEGQALYA
jgi:hypothetical protein